MWRRYLSEWTGEPSGAKACLGGSSRSTNRVPAAVKLPLVLHGTASTVKHRLFWLRIATS